MGKVGQQLIRVCVLFSNERTNIGSICVSLLFFYPVNSSLSLFLCLVKTTFFNNLPVGTAATDWPSVDLLATCWRVNHGGSAWERRDSSEAVNLPLKEKLSWFYSPQL